MENKNLSEQIAKVLSGLTDEQKEKVKACKGLDEIAACLGEMGVALPDELLDGVAGGATYRYNSYRQSWEVVLKDGTVIETDIRREKDAYAIANYWTYVEKTCGI